MKDSRSKVAVLCAVGAVVAVAIVSIAMTVQVITKAVCNLDEN